MEKKRKNNLSGMIDLNTQKMLWNYDFVPSDNHLLSQDTWQHKSGKVLIAFQAPKYYVVVWGNGENVYNFDNCERKKYIGFKDYFPNILQKLQKILINHTSDTALQKLELQLAIHEINDSNNRISSDLERWYFTVYPKEPNKYWTPIYYSFKVLETIYHLVPSSHQQIIEKIQRILNANLNISIENPTYPERAGEYIYNSLKEDKNDLANKFLNAIFRYIFDNVPSDQKNEMTKALELIKNSGLNGLFGTSKTENDNAAQKLLDSIKDAELKDVIKPYFNAVPKKDRLSEKPKILIFGADAVYVGNPCCMYKIKYNVPKELVGKASSSTLKSAEDIFAKAEKNKQGIKYPPYTFDKEHTKYILDKYEVLDCNGICKYFFKIGTEYFDPIYLSRCLKYSGKIYNSEIYENGNPLFSKSEDVDYLLMPIYVDHERSETTLVDFINDEIIEEYLVTNTILHLFDSYIFEVLKIDLLEHLEHYSYRVSDLKQLQNQVDEFKRLNSAYQLLTGKECAEIPDVNLNPYVEGQLNLCEFIAEDDDLRPHLWCIGYQSGYALATDSYLLVAVTDQYKKSREGRTYNIIGYDVTDSYLFPNAIGVFNDTLQQPSTRITIDFDRLKTAIKLSNKLPKETEKLSTRGVLLECGAMFRTDLLEKVLYFLDYCHNPRIYITEKQVLVIRDYDNIHNMLLMPRTDAEVFVSCVDLKYHLRRVFYGKEGDRITSIVKGNCVTFEDTALHKLELKLFDKD